MKSLAFIKTVSQLDTFAKRLGGKLREALIIAVDPDVEPELARRGYTYRSVWEYIDPADFKGVDSQASDLAATWFQPAANDLTVQGLSVGEAVRWHTEFFFRETIVAQIVAEKILDKEKPLIIFFDGEDIRPAVMGADRQSNSNGTLNLTLAYQASRRNIHCTPVAESRGLALLYSAAACFENFGLPGAGYRAYNLRFFSPALLLKKIIPSWLARPFIALGHRFKWRHDYRNPKFPRIEKKQAQRICLFWGDEGVDFQRSLELADALRNEASDIRPLVLGEVPARHKGQPDLIDVYQCRYFSCADKFDWYDLQKKIIAFLSQRENANPSGIWESFLANRLFRLNFMNYLLRFNFLWWFRMAVKMLTETKAEIFVTRYPMAMDTWAFRKAISRLGVPTKIIYTPHGVTCGMYKCTRVKDYALALVDRFATGGEIMNLTLLEKGIPPEKLSVTGFQLLDRYRDVAPPQKIPKAGTGYRILVLTSWFYETIPLYWDTKKHLRTLQSIIGLADIFPDLQLFFKPHPRYDCHNVLEKLCGGAQPATCRIVDPSTPLRQVLPEMDAVVIANSGTSSVIECLMAQKPVLMALTARSPFCPEELPAVKWQGVHCIHHDEDFAPIIKRLRTDPSFHEEIIQAGQRFMKRYENTGREAASEKIARLINLTALTTIHFADASHGTEQS